MSYIVAFVSALDSRKEFPVQCFRTDLVEGDEVVIRRGDGQLARATVVQLKYLNWECKGQIECRVSEACLEADRNIVLPKGAPLVYGASTHGALIEALRALGWISMKSKQRMYRAILANTNTTSTSYIFVRKNGIDIQFLPHADNSPIMPFSLYERSLSEGTVVRHSLAHTTFNLFEGILRYSSSFLNNEADLDRYFVPQGSKDKRTDELRAQSKNRGQSKDDGGIDVVGEYSDDMQYGYHCK